MNVSILSLWEEITRPRIISTSLRHLNKAPNLGRCFSFALVNGVRKFWEQKRRHFINVVALFLLSIKKPQPTWVLNCFSGFPNEYLWIFACLLFALNMGKSLSQQFFIWFVNNARVTLYYRFPELRLHVLSSRYDVPETSPETGCQEQGRGQKLK